MVMEMMGPSLECLFKFCKRRFSVKTTLMLIDNLVQRIEIVHQCNFIHRDIKPDNFLIGLGKKQSTIFVIDFGLSKRFRDPRTGDHI